MVISVRLSKVEAAALDRLISPLTRTMWLKRVVRGALSGENVYRTGGNGAISGQNPTEVISNPPES